VAKDRTIDEAFSFLGENVAAFTDLIGEIVDHDAGVRMQIEELSIETPVELDVRVDEAGAVHLGCAPPLYAVEATVEPVFHRLRIRAVAKRHGEHQNEEHQNGEHQNGEHQNPVPAGD
jgi:hypothetical protein